MQKLSPQTKSLLLLLGIIFIGTGIIFNVSEYWSLGNNKIIYQQKAERNPAVKETQQTAETINVDTQNWKTYENKDYSFSFKYKPDWKILPQVKKGEFTVIDIDPGKKYYNIEIFISKKGYYIMDGLPAKTEGINGKTFQNVNNLLYGVVNGPYYLTLDIGKSLSLTPNFNALVHSLNFE